MTESSKQSNFEESLRRLEEIVTLLDGGKADLETSLACYEEGVKLLRRCRSILTEAEQRIEILKKIDESTGELVTKTIDPNAFRSDKSTPGRQNDPAAAEKTARTSPPQSVGSVVADAIPAKPKRSRSTGTKKRAALNGGDGPSPNEDGPIGHPDDNAGTKSETGRESGHRPEANAGPGQVTDRKTDAPPSPADETSPDAPFEANGEIPPSPSTAEKSSSDKTAIKEVPSDAFSASNEFNASNHAASDPLRETNASDGLDAAPEPKDNFFNFDDDHF